MADKSFSYLTANFKRKLINTLVSNEDIITIISPEIKYGLDVEDILRGGTFDVIVGGKKQREILQGYILDYYYAASDTTVENKLFICIETNVATVEKGILATLVADIWIFTPKTNVTLSEYTTPNNSDINGIGYIGNRIDVCVQMIENFLKGSEEYGLGRVLPSERGYMSMSAPNTLYYGKKLSFTVTGYSPREADNCGN